MVSNDAICCPNCGKRKSAGDLILSYILVPVFLIFGIKYEISAFILIPTALIWTLATIIIWKLRFR